MIINSPPLSHWISLQEFLKHKMRTFTASLVVAGLALTQGRPQGILNGISNLLTSAFGGGNSGEVDDYQNAPYEVIQKYDVRQKMSKNFTYGYVKLNQALFAQSFGLNPICHYQGYEERFYPSRLWVCTRSSSDNGGFMKLFRYISGANARSGIDTVIYYLHFIINIDHFRAED